MGTERLSLRLSACLFVHLSQCPDWLIKYDVTFKVVGGRVIEGYDSSWLNYKCPSYCPFQIPGTDLSVCVVLKQTDEYTEFVGRTRYPNRMIFHQLDFDDQSLSKCNHFKRASLKGKMLNQLIRSN